MSILGVVMAGGRNVRFGDIKAFAQINGVRIIDRVIEALRGVTEQVVLSANDAVVYGQLGLPMRADARDDLGPLSGIYTALQWAAELRHDGILAVACDMPFPSASLLHEIIDNAGSHDAVLPESDGRRGVEPLFAYYSVQCIPAIEAAVARDDRRMISFHDDVDVYRLPIEHVRTHGDPDVLFMNINTQDDLQRALKIAEDAE